MPELEGRDALVHRASSVSHSFSTYTVFIVTLIAVGLLGVNFVIDSMLVAQKEKLDTTLVDLSSLQENERNIRYLSSLVSFYKTEIDQRDPVGVKLGTFIDLMPQNLEYSTVSFQDKRFSFAMTSSEVITYLNYIYDVLDITYVEGVVIKSLSLNTRDDSYTASIDIIVQ